ncbi:hypothetical protein MBLNU13_g10328t1 [Cladosporium sp. NU13]
MSLALGRPPSLIRLPYPPEEILDKFDDVRVWKPVHAKEVSDSFELCHSWVTSTMCVFSSLHEITTDMMLLFAQNLPDSKLTTGFADEASRTSEEQEITAEDGSGSGSGRPGGGTAQISEVVGGGSAAGQPDVTTAMGAVQEMNSGEMARWDVDLGFSGNFDTSAGFHPDSFL